MTEAKRAAWPRRQYVDGPFGQIHFQVHGDGAPLVMIHQAPAHSGQFDNAYEPLAARGFMAIGIDMPGFGGSDPTPHTPYATDYAQIVLPVLDALGIEKTALLGHHTGTIAANEAAIAHPDRITALILNGPLLVTEEDRANFLKTLHPWEKNYAAREHAGHMVELFDIRDRLAHGEVAPARLSDYVIHALTGRGEFWYGHHAAYMYDLAPRLPLITQPTLILTNTGDSIYPHALEVHQMRPDFAFACLEGGGVDIVDQQTEAWADIVTGFLNAAARKVAEAQDA